MSGPSPEWATPMLAPTCTVRSASRTGWSSARPIRSTIAQASAAEATSARITANSSPPSRATQSDCRADAANRCASTCATCSDACLHGEDAGSMTRCIDLDNQCAAICRTTADILSRPGPNGDSWRAIVEACIAVCTECAEECEQHADHHDHCRICAEACRACAEACRALLGVAD